MTPINPEQVQRTSQILLSYLEDPRNNTPNDMLEGIISGKSLLRGILSGTLFVCQKNSPQPGAEPDETLNEIDPEKAAESS